MALSDCESSSTSSEDFLEEMPAIERKPETPLRKQTQEGTIGQTAKMGKNAANRQRIRYGQIRAEVTFVY